MSSTVLLTGGTGFLGQHMVSALQDAGYRVRALVRGNPGALTALGAETAHGDVLDAASLDEAMRGVDHVVHAAGFVSRDVEDTRVMMEVNVQGTRKVVEAAARAAVKKIVHVSTSGTIAVGDEPVVFHEDDPLPLAHIHRWPYYLSKFLAEKAASDAIRLSSSTTRPELVTLNPTLALGPGDTRGTSTLDVRRFLDREIPLLPSGGVSFVDVRDVAACVPAALTRGTDGERYLLGALNLTFVDFFRRLEQVSGVKGPMVPFALPKALSTFGVSLLERAAQVLGAKSPVTSIEAEMASCFWYVDSRKAKEELGFSTTDPQKTLLDTVRFLRGEKVGMKAVQKRA
jgi:dihydroflavonol-4-reductase